jgi:transposase InsO family protein
MRSSCERLPADVVISQCEFSRSQIYEWRHGVKERKHRKRKIFPQETVENAVGVIMDYPHMGGRKGQVYMIYHRLGYISINAYDRVKKSVKRLVFQEVSKRRLLPPRTRYEHEKPEKVGQIWAEDFTELKVYGQAFKASLLIDVASQYNLGAYVSKRESAALVEQPVIQALSANGGKGPEDFLLSDNGSSYVSDKHGKLLEKADIVHKRIPACRPQYNGVVECGIKEFKNVFYNVWAKRESGEADKEKSLPSRVEAAVMETVRLLNQVIPKPSLNGVTPADLHQGVSSTKVEGNRQYRDRGQQKPDTLPWNRNYWDVLKGAMGLENMTRLVELVTKFCFFCPRPLRKIANLGLEGVG